MKEFELFNKTILGRLLWKQNSNNDFLDCALEHLNSNKEITDKMIKNVIQTLNDELNVARTKKLTKGKGKQKIYLYLLPGEKKIRLIDYKEVVSFLGNPNEVELPQALSVNAAKDLDPVTNALSSLPFRPLLDLLSEPLSPEKTVQVKKALESKIPRVTMVENTGATLQQWLQFTQYTRATAVFLHRFTAAKTEDEALAIFNQVDPYIVKFAQNSSDSLLLKKFSEAAAEKNKQNQANLAINSNNQQTNNNNANKVNQIILPAQVSVQEQKPVAKPQFIRSDDKNWDVDEFIKQLQSCKNGGYNLYRCISLTLKQVEILSNHPQGVEVKKYVQNLLGEASNHWRNDAPNWKNKVSNPANNNPLPNAVQQTNNAKPTEAALQNTTASPQPLTVAQIHPKLQTLNLPVQKPSQNGTVTVLMPVVNQPGLQNNTNNKRPLENNNNENEASKKLKPNENLTSIQSNNNSNHANLSLFKASPSSTLANSILPLPISSSNGYYLKALEKLLNITDFHLVFSMIEENKCLYKGTSNQSEYNWNDISTRLAHYILNLDDDTISFGEFANDAVKQKISLTLLTKLFHDPAAPLFMPIVTSNNNNNNNNNNTGVEQVDLTNDRPAYTGPR